MQSCTSSMKFQLLSDSGGPAILDKADAILVITIAEGTTVCTPAY